MHINVPVYLSVAFIFLSLLTMLLFYKATGYSKKALGLMLAWSIITSVMAHQGVFHDVDAMPPKFFFALGPFIIFTLIMFNVKSGQEFIDRLDLESLTILHVIRIPVEIGLFYLFIFKTIPEVMTFEGRNFDIIAGITAPIVYFFVFLKQIWSSKVLLIWNILCLGLLINIIFHGVFSAPFPFQKFGLDQPNLALINFPFSLLPFIIVPIVIFSHLAAIRQIIRKKIND